MLLLVLPEVDVRDIQSARDRNHQKRRKIRQKDVLPICADSDAERENRELKEPDLPPCKCTVAENIHRN